MSKAIFVSNPVNFEQPVSRHPPQALIRTELARAGVLMIRIVGAPGAGKTELIEATLHRLAGPKRVGVIVINPAARRDADRLRASCAHVESIDASIPRASAIWEALQHFSLKDLDMILIETCGGLAPVDDLGQNATAVAFAVSGGDDKAAEYAGLLSAASAVLITKTDLASFVRFDQEAFKRDLQTINPSAEVFEISTINGTGFTAWRNWLESRQAAKSRAPGPATEKEQFTTDSFIG